MNAERLLAHYHEIAGAPDAVTGLRRFIIDLAMCGKLVPQDANDEPASELLKRIAEEKARLVNAGEIGSHELLTEIDTSAFPVEQPAGWVLTRLATISRRIHYGYTASADADLKDVRMLRITDIQENAVDWPSVPGCLIGPETVEQYKLHEGDILIARTGGTIGKTFLVGDVPITAVFASYLIRVQGTSHVFDQYLKRFLESSLYWTQLRDGTRGTGQPNVNGQTLGRLVLPLPPLEEQRRIVAKVDELMALCDRLDAAQVNREAVRDRLAAASLARLTAPDPETFQADARFALDALQALTTRPDQIKQLRQTILNLAVRGRLRAEGAWNAELITLGEVASLQNGYAFKSEWFSKVGTRLLRNANVGHGTLNWEDEVRLPDIKVREYERFRLNEGDIVVSLDRPFIVTGTKVARVLSRDLPALLLQRVGRFVLSPKLHPDYLFLWISSPHFTGQIDPGRSNGVPHISSKQVEAAEIFVPPLTEQLRIVAKVHALMALCDRLEASLTTAADTRRRLLDALLAEALAPAENRELEAAE